MKKSPFKEYIHNTSAGYDLLSLKDEDTKKKLLIEVKSSEKSLGAAKAYITRNEYNKALEHENYQFHFWLLKERMLAVLDRNKVIDTAPKDTKEGSWNKFTVPYMAFQDEFKKV